MANKLGKTIRILRQAKDYKLSEVASKAGISVPFLSLVENGERQPSLEVIRGISRSLGVPFDVLVSAGSEAGELEIKRGKSGRLTDTLDSLFNMEQQLRDILRKEGGGGAAKRKRP